MAIVHGVYKVSDSNFSDYPDPFLKGNKGENRPCYYCFKGESNILWMIPISSAAEKVKLAKRKISERKTDIFHITNIGGKEGVMLVPDIFPITEEYLGLPYLINNVHYIFKNPSEVAVIHKKASKVLALLRRGVNLTGKQADIFRIERSLIEISESYK